MYIDKNTQADFYFYSEMVKDSRGSLFEAAVKFNNLFIHLLVLETTSPSLPIH